MAILQLDPPLPLEVVANPDGIPTGPGLAFFLADQGIEHHALWVVGLDASGEIWWTPNPYVRLRANPTAGRVGTNAKSAKRA